MGNEEGQQPEPTLTDHLIAAALKSDDFADALEQASIEQLEAAIVGTTDEDGEPLKGNAGRVQTLKAELCDMLISEREHAPTNEDGGHALQPASPAPPGALAMVQQLLCYPEPIRRACLPTVPIDTPLSKKNISKRKGPAGAGMLSYVEGGYVINALNESFGPVGWGHEVTHMETRLIKVEVPAEQKGGGTRTRVKWDAVTTCRVRLMAWGCVHEDVGHGYPQGPMKRQRDAIQFAEKTAVTDALKRAARHLGARFGLALYRDDREMIDDGRAERQAKEEARERAEPETKPVEIKTKPEKEEPKKKRADPPKETESASESGGTSATDDADQAGESPDPGSAGSDEYIRRKDGTLDAEAIAAQLNLRGMDLQAARAIAAKVVDDLPGAAQRLNKAARKVWDRETAAAMWVEVGFEPTSDRAPTPEEVVGFARLYAEGIQAQQEN